MNSSPKVRLAELTCTITYCGAWGRTFRGNDQNSSASHLMPAQNALKTHFLLLNFLLKQTQSFLSTWTTRQIWQPHSLAHFLKIKIKLKDCCFGTLERIQCPLQKDKFKGTKIKKLSENSYQAHETTDRQQQNLNQVRFYIFMVLSSEHFDHIFYITLLIQNLRTLFSQDSPNYISHSLCQASIKHIINVLLINSHNCKVG